MKLKDKEAWEEIVKLNSDSYGSATIRFVAAWAMLMEEAMSRGFQLCEIADETSHEADKAIGITGFMYGMAVAILSKQWEHGEELRKWHNVKTQIGNEGEKANESGGTLNPALLNIGVKDD